MKVFLSSVITGFEPFRDAAATAARLLGHDAVRAEDFRASSASPQVACLDAVRHADVVLLVLGGRYGARQASGLSATHEEWNEAKGTRDVLAFVQTGVSREADQERLVSEVQAWDRGRLTAPFATPVELQAAVAQALRDLEVSRVQGAADEGEMLARARDLVPGRHDAFGATLCLVLVGGPRQQVLRPPQLDAEALHEALMQEALFGPTAVLARSEGTTPRRRGSVLVFEQPRSSVLIDQLGTIRIMQPARREDRDSGALPVLIEEEVRDRLGRAVRYAANVLDRIDSSRRLAEVAPVVALFGAGHIGWRTRAEHEAKPDSITIGMRFPEVIVVQPDPPTLRRPALSVDQDRLVEDLTVLLREATR